MFKDPIWRRTLELVVGQPVRQQRVAEHHFLQLRGQLALAAFVRPSLGDRMGCVCGACGRPSAADPSGDVMWL